MRSERPALNLRGVSLSSLIFGILGGAFFWWVPMGIVMSLTGLTFGFVDWTMARRRSLDYRLSVAGILFSAFTLAFDLVIAALGMQTLTLGGR